MGDPAEFRVHAGREDERLGLAGHELSSGQEHVSAVAEFVFVAGGGGASERVGFSGDRGVVDPRSVGRQHAAIGWHAFACLKEEHISRHQVFRGDLSQVAVPPHVNLVREELLQSGECPFRPIFLPEGEEAVDDDHAHDRGAEQPHPGARFRPLGEKSQPRREPENDREKVRERVEEPPPQRCRSHAAETILAELLEPPLHFGRRQPTRAAVQTVESLRGA